MASRSCPTAPSFLLPCCPPAPRHPPSHPALLRPSPAPPASSPDAPPPPATANRRRARLSLLALPPPSSPQSNIDLTPGNDGVAAIATASVSSYGDVAAQAMCRRDSPRERAAPYIALGGVQAFEYEDLAFNGLNTMGVLSASGPLVQIMQSSQVQNARQSDLRRLLQKTFIGGTVACIPDDPTNQHTKHTRGACRTGGRPARACRPNRSLPCSWAVISLALLREGLGPA